MGVIAISLPVLSTEPVLRKAAVKRELRFSTEQYGCRQRNDFVKCALECYFIVCFFLFCFVYLFWVQPVPEIVCYCLKCFSSLANSLFYR